MPAGRPNKYFTHIQPRLDEIREWALYNTDEVIARKLGVTPQSFCGYKKRYPELFEVLKIGREQLVADVKNAMIRKAKGFQYEERKVTKEGGVIIREEIYTRAALPDVAAANLLLKNYDRDFWRNDPAADEHRRKELELQERKLEAAEW